MSRIPLLVLLTACAWSRSSPAAAPPSPAPPAAPPAPAPAPAPAPTPAPPPSAAPSPPPAPPKLLPCNNRKVSYTLARATGMGSYITTLTCSASLYTVISDRATPDGKEVTTAYEVPQVEWEKAWRAIEALGWPTLDDRCTDAERARGRGEGPVYRITIDDGWNKRSFTCAAMRDLTAPLDGLQAQLLALAPPEIPEAAAARPIGVPECDEYLERYQKCVDQRVPAAGRPSFLEAIRFTRDALRDAYMRKPDGAKALAAQCKEMHAAARAAMATFKCRM